MTGISKCADVALPDILESTDGHGWIFSDSRMTPLWFDGPDVARDVAMEDETNGNDEARTSDDEMELSDIDEYVISSDTDDDSYWLCWVVHLSCANIYDAVNALWK